MRRGLSGHFGAITVCLATYIETDRPNTVDDAPDLCADDGIDPDQIFLYVVVLFFFMRDKKSCAAIFLVGDRRPTNASVASAWVLTKGPIRWKQYHRKNCV